MKKLIALFLALLAIIPAEASADLYLLFGNVVDLEWDSDCVTVDDGYGNLWEFFGCDHFYFDDLAIMIMDDHGTPDWIYDDAVIEANPCDAGEAAEIIAEYRESLREKMTTSFIDLFKTGV